MEISQNTKIDLLVVFLSQFIDDTYLLYFILVLSKLNL